jgi:uncharacterized membrane protein YdjX (TVP38/TMEM64 family)
MRGSGTAVHVGVGAAVIAAVVLATIVLPLGRWVDALVEWTRHEGVLGLAGFSLAFLVLTVTMLPTVEMYIGAGLIYGTGWGTLLTTLLSLAGAMLAFWIARTSLRGWIERHIDGNGTLEHFDRGVGEHSFLVATLLRVSPILPYGPTNYALSATRISPGMYALTALVGTAPTNLLYAYAGSLLHKVTELDTARTPAHEVLLWGGVSATLALSVLLGWIAKRALAHASR